MNGRSIHKKHNAEDVHLNAALWGDAQKPASALLLFTMPALVCSWHALTSMDGGNADFAGAKICQNNALILAFGHRQNL